MTYKAKFIGAVKKNRFDRHAWEHTDLAYEYRGYTYVITKDNNGYMGKSLAAQHREEQARIDETIAHKDEPIAWQYEGSAQQAFDEWLYQMLDE